LKSGAKSPKGGWERASNKFRNTDVTCGIEKIDINDLQLS